MYKNLRQTKRNWHRNCNKLDNQSTTHPFSPGPNLLFSTTAVARILWSGCSPSSFSQRPLLRCSLTTLNASLLSLITSLSFTSLSTNTLTLFSLESFSCFSCSAVISTSASFFFSVCIPFAIRGAGFACSDFGWDFGDDIVGLLSIEPFSLMDVT